MSESMATFTRHSSLGHPSLQLWDTAATCLCGFKGVQSPGEMHRGWPTWAWWDFAAHRCRTHIKQAQTISSSWSFLMATHLVCVAKFVVCHKLHVCFVKSLHALVLVSCFCPYLPVARGPYKVLKQSSSVSPTLTRLGSHHCISHHLSVLFPGTASQRATALLSLAQAGLF